MVVATFKFHGMHSVVMNARGLFGVINVIQVRACVFVEVVVESVVADVEPA